VQELDSSPEAILNHGSSFLFEAHQQTLKMAPKGVMKSKRIGKFGKPVENHTTGEAAIMRRPAAQSAVESVEDNIEQILSAIHNTISSVPYNAAPAAGVQLHPAALTSTDPHGFPSTRTVIPSFIAPDLSQIHLTTHRGTRKEIEIKENPKVSLHFQDPRGKGGWATIKGDASLRPGADAMSLEILMCPCKCEVMSYTEGIMGDDDGWMPRILVKKGSTGSWKLAQ